MAKRPQHGQQDGGARGGDQLRASDRSICGEMVRYQLTGRRGGGGGRCRVLRSRAYGGRTAAERGL